MVSQTFETNRFMNIMSPYKLIGLQKAYMKTKHTNIKKSYVFGDPMYIFSENGSALSPYIKFFRTNRTWLLSKSYQRHLAVYLPKVNSWAICELRTMLCELVGIYIQNKLCKLTNKNYFGLHRDDGLGILRNTSGPEVVVLHMNWNMHWV